jgi:hypothetical protein
MFLLSTATRWPLGPTLYNGYRRFFPRELLQPPANAEVRNTWSYNYIPPYVLMLWCLKEHEDNSTFACSSNVVLHDNVIK